MTSPPVGLSGLLERTNHFLPRRLLRAASASSPMVLPRDRDALAVQQPAFVRRCASSASAAGADTRSVATKRPPGFRSASSGVRALMRSKSSMESSTPASCAMASRCSTALVEPPRGGHAGDGVLERLAREDLRRPQIAPQQLHHHARPACLATSSFLGSVAGTLALPIGESPRNSHAVAMVLAVNCPPQAPGAGTGAGFRCPAAPRRSSCPLRVRAHRLEHVLNGDVVALETARARSSRRRASGRECSAAPAP